MAIHYMHLFLSKFTEFLQYYWNKKFLTYRLNILILTFDNMFKRFYTVLEKNIGTGINSKALVKYHSSSRNYKLIYFNLILIL